MLLSEFKTALKQVEQIKFMLPNGHLVPNNFHVTEVGQIKKHFMDCGGQERIEEVINFQLWVAEDYDHRLSAFKLKGIIGLSERVLKLDDIQIEVEYQSDTIGKYGLEFDGQVFLLTSKQTDCLAKENCGIPETTLIEKEGIAEIQSCCSPSLGCC